MCVLIASDIFGQTTALDTLVGRLESDTLVADPYGGIRMDFRSESDAYQYFQTNVGHATYRLQLKHTVQSHPDIRQLIGFSVGASACWQLLADEQIHTLEQGLCFYGSQIRHHLDLKPRRPTKLILPREEPSFDLQILTSELRGTHNIELIHTPYLHGFMNQRSQNFDPLGYEQLLEWANTETAIR